MASKGFGKLSEFRQGVESVDEYIDLFQLHCAAQKQQKQTTEGCKGATKTIKVHVGRGTRGEGRPEGVPVLPTKAGDSAGVDGGGSEPHIVHTSGHHWVLQRFRI